MSIPLIAPKPFAEFTPDEYHAYISSMYFLKQGKNPSPAPGLSVTRNKKSGKLSIKRLKGRAFDYVTYVEVEALAKKLETTQTEVWNAFREREFILAKSRMEAENTYADIKSIPF